MTEHDFSNVIGKTIFEAEQLHDCFDFRIVAVDGKSRIITMDYRLDRVNVEVEDGKITKVQGIG